MKQLVVIGNLGADAEVKAENGSKFVRMSIAETVRRKKEDGTVNEHTNWISATINGDGGELLQYLKKGTKVFVMGDCETRLYHSEKQRAMVAGLKVFVRTIELISVNNQEVPHTLYDIDGIAHVVKTWYHCPDCFNQLLYSRSNEEFSVDEHGWVTSTRPQVTEDNLSQQNETSNEQGE